MQNVGNRFRTYTVSDLSGLWGTRSPTRKASSGAAVYPEVRYHMHIVRKVIGTRRELWIIVKEPREYQDKLMAFLKPYGPLKDTSPAKITFLDERLEDKRAELAQEEEEKLKDPEGYKQRRGLGFRSRRGGRGGSTPN